MSESWKANRLRYMAKHYGSWSNLIDNTKKNKFGISTIVLPQSVIDEIAQDPACHPPRIPSLFGTFISFKNFIR